jgi:hypothetical protein
VALDNIPILDSCFDKFAAYKLLTFSYWILLFRIESFSLFGWLVAEGWCWFVLREEYFGWLLVAGLL